MASTPLYALRVPEVYQALETSPQGLTPEEAQARLALYGPNTLADPPAPPLWRHFIGHLTHLMALLLWAAGALALIGGEPVLAAVIWVVVLVNAAFSFWQEHRAERAVTALKHLLPAYARVIRAGKEMHIPASELVPGDVILLAEGDNVPADARVVEEYGLRANHATLTGEAVPVRKTAEASLREGLTELERTNLVFAGTSIVSGTGRAVVYNTGMLTQFGRIARLTQAVREAPSLLQQQVVRVTRRIALFALVLGGIVFLVSIMEVGLPHIEAFVLALGIIVAAIPEGLLPTITLSLAIAVERLARRGVLVKKLAVVETLGTTSVICADKSGTLTQNQMTVREVWVSGQRLSVSGVGYEPKGQFIVETPGYAQSDSAAPQRPPPEKREGGGIPPEVQADLEALLIAADLCNNARLNPPSPERPQWTCLGDATEAALRVLALKGGVDEPALARTYPRVHELPFDARRKRMSTIHRNRRSETAFVKGAPREVLQLCTTILMHGEVRPLDADTRAEIMRVNDEFARNALRVLALARRDLPPRTGSYTPEQVERDLTFLGLVAMMDPPRPEVAAAIQMLRQAGIRIVMVTGDYGLTAESVARRIGLLTTPRPRILTGADVDTMTDAQLQAVLDQEIIFARMAPEHKLRLVAAFQARGEVVAVTGDGVNDAPALRKADIGISMGIAGSDVAKEAADVILTNDNFAAIVSAIEEGRAVYDNIRKFITYIFASNVPEILPFVLTALFKIPLALRVAQILAIDLGTDLLPALALGAERPEPGVMHRPPRRRAQPLLDRGLLLRAYVWLGGIETVLCYIGFLLVYVLAGALEGLRLPWLDGLPRISLPPEQLYLLATTVFFAGVVMAQVGNAFACRTEKERIRQLGLLSNRFLLVGIAAEIAVALALIYVQPLATVFEHVPLPPFVWLGLILYAPVLFMLEWARKRIVRHMEIRNGGGR
jgi:Ca2+-transporting ATPase